MSLAADVFPLLTPLVLKRGFGQAAVAILTGSPLTMTQAKSISPLVLILDSPLAGPLCWGAIAELLGQQLGTTSTSELDRVIRGLLKSKKVAVPEEEGFEALLAPVSLMLRKIVESAAMDDIVVCPNCGHHQP